MQEQFLTVAYSADMTAKSHDSQLKVFRETAGLSLRELARRIGEDHSNVRYWESGGHLPRADVLIPMAKALGVSVEELLGEPKPKRIVGPAGRLGQVFDAASRLPRRQQQKVAEFVEAFVERQLADQAQRVAASS